MFVCAFSWSIGIPQMGEGWCLLKETKVAICIAVPDKGLVYPNSLCVRQQTVCKILVWSVGFLTIPWYNLIPPAGQAVKRNDLQDAIWIYGLTFATHFNTWLTNNGLSKPQAAKFKLRVLPILPDPFSDLEVWNRSGERANRELKPEQGIHRISWFTDYCQLKGATEEKGHFTHLFT